jgi:hypothetical protein
VILLLAKAYAASCCVGSTSALPTRLGPCEEHMVGALVHGQGSSTRWDSDGQLVRSSLESRSVSVTAYGALRVNPRMQLGVALPMQASVHTASGQSSQGGGLGDARLSMLVEPTSLGAAPWAVASLRLPAGRSWRQSDDPLAADVTGRAGLGLTLVAGYGNTEGSWPWALTAGVGAESGGLLAPELSATLGRTLGPGWTLAGGLSHQESLAPASGWARAAETTASISVVRGRQAAWRAWGSVDSGVPLPGLGSDFALERGLSLGFAKLF